MVLVKHKADNLFIDEKIHIYAYPGNYKVFKLIHSVQFTTIRPVLELVAAESFSSGALSLVLGDETTSEIPVADSVWLLLAFISITKVYLFRKMYTLNIVIIAIKLNKIDEKNTTF